MTLIISAATLLIIWYYVCDYFASTYVVYKFPEACSQCDSTQLTAEGYEISRDYGGFSFGLDALEVLFPRARRSAEVPFCVECATKARTRVSELKSTINFYYFKFNLDNIILYSSVVVGIGSGVFLYPRLAATNENWIVICALPFVMTITGLFWAAGVNSLIKYVIRIRFVERAEPPPAQFNFFGNISFRRKSYQHAFKRQGWQRGYRLRQKSAPNTVFSALFILVIASVIEGFFDLLVTPPLLTTINAYSVLFGMEIVSLVFIYRQKWIGVWMWVAVFAGGLILHWATAADHLEEFITGIAILLIIGFETWQTRKDKQQLTDGDFVVTECTCKHPMVIVRDMHLYDYLKTSGILGDTDIVKFEERGYHNCSGCGERWSKYILFRRWREST